MNHVGPAPIIYFVIFFVVASILDKHRRKANPEIKRRNDLAALARKLGLQFKSDCDFELAERYSFLSWLRRGEARCASHVFRGKYLGYPVIIFDYFFGLSGSKGDNYYWSAYILELEADFPDTIISRETMEVRLLQTLGESHITFESAEFSRSFNVQSADKKFAFAVCNAEMMTYLLANRDLIVEIHQGALLLVSEDWLRPEKVEPNLSRLIKIRRLLPQYLFSKQ